MSNPLLPAKNPCGSCPYRTDVPSGVWSESEYVKLPDYDVSTAFQPSGLFMCHQVDGRMCAGWVGCHDMTQSLGVRIAATTGELSDEDIDAVYEYTTEVELFESGQAAADHGVADIEAPSRDAVRAVNKIIRRTRG